MKTKFTKSLTVGLALAALALVAVNNENLLFAAEQPESKAPTPTRNEIVLASDVQWTALG